MTFDISRENQLFSVDPKDFERKQSCYPILYTNTQINSNDLIQTSKLDLKKKSQDAKPDFERVPMMNDP